MASVDPISEPTAGSGLDAVYYIHQWDMEQVARQLAPVTGTNILLGQAHYFSAWGPYMRPVAVLKPCAHYLAPLDASFRRALVIKGAIPLPVSPELAAVLGTMLAAMGRSAEVWIEFSRSMLDSAPGLTPAYLQEALPSTHVEGVPNGARHWIRLLGSEDVADNVATLDCIYPLLVPRFAEFARVLANAGQPIADPAEDYSRSAERDFIYSMHWALESMGVMGYIFRRFALTGAMKGLDVGGSFGFLACALARRGHLMINMELQGWRVEQVMPWLADACGVADRAKGMAGRMEEIDGPEGHYDFICFMGSLLLCPRELVGDVLRRAMRRLRPGGLLILRENFLPEAQRDARPDSRFTCRELHSCLLEHAGTPIYFCHQGAERSFGEVLSRSMIYVAVQKPGAGAPEDVVKPVGGPLRWARGVTRRAVHRLRR